MKSARRPRTCLAAALWTALAAAPLIAAPPRPLVPQETAGPDRAIDDVRLASVLRADLDESTHVSADGIELAVVRGVVTLEGVVPDLLSAKRAVRIASSLRGVRSVIDRLIVEPGDVSDDELAESVDLALLLDPTTDAWEIDVVAAGGRVRLEGVVESHAERELAETVATGVHGVRSVDNRLTVAHDGTRSDAEIKDDVEGRLEWNVLVDEDRIDVAVEDGRVVLAGAVASHAQVALVRSLASVEGVDRVDTSGLHVAWWKNHPARAMDSPPADDAIKQAVYDALVHDPRVVAFEPDVTVLDGVVRLQGTVDSLKARRAAAEDARNTTGVRSVHNLLTVEPAEPSSAAVVEKRAHEALARDMVVHDEPVLVTVEDGLAVLDGEVSTWFARAQAEDVVARVSGVRALRNDLTVRDAPPHVTWRPVAHDWDPVLRDVGIDALERSVEPDAALRTGIASELAWSPFVDREQVEIDVTAGVATLRGTVDSARERLVAAERALDAGAVRVINELLVRGVDVGT